MNSLKLINKVEEGKVDSETPCSHTKNSLKLEANISISDVFGNKVNPGEKVVILLRHGTALGHYLCQNNRDQYVYLTSFIRDNRIYYNYSYSNYTPLKADWYHPKKDLYFSTTNKILSDIFALDTSIPKLILEISPNAYNLYRT